MSQKGTIETLIVLRPHSKWVLVLCYEKHNEEMWAFELTALSDGAALCVSPSFSGHLEEETKIGIGYADFKTVSAAIDKLGDLLDKVAPDQKADVLRRTREFFAGQRRSK